MEKRKNTAGFPVATGIYPREAVFAAANTFAGKAFVRIRGGKKGNLSVELRVKPGINLAAADLEGEFFNELLHHSLRLKVSIRHKVLREKIVAQALVSARVSGASKPAAKQEEKPADDKALEKEIENLLKEAEAGGYKGDPLGIAVPWEKSANAGGVKDGPPGMDLPWGKLKEAYPDGPPDIAALWEKGKAEALAGKSDGLPGRPPVRVKKRGRKSGK
ncbi:MAG: hypothetical protein COT18_09430 [Elusimicrobia bacterium CG08_land_8_20_14_0_20_59_10]|nr:MAG: hypothetical protein COT18_09430 [Elusimicrobia bacterium CG08_land_8_20_14_0_20_59_10]